MQLVTHHLSRRTFLLGPAAAALAGCATNNRTPEQMTLSKQVQSPSPISSDPELQARYAAFEDGGHFIPAIPYQNMDPKYYRQRVADPTGEKAGTVVVDTPNRFLYLVEEGGTAMRYGVGIGRDGFAWEGEGYHPLAPAMATMETSCRDDRSSAGAGNIFRCKRWHGSRDHDLLGHGRSTSSRTGKTLYIGCTVVPSGSLSARASLPDASD